MPETVIKIENLRKQYRLGTIGGGTLRADIQSWWARKRGKEDPNTVIGTETASVGETFYALDGINLEVKRGEALGIIGANGAGKSTLLKLLSRVTAPTEGTIKINGRIASMLEVGTGFHPELTGRENIYMNGAILGMTKAEIDSKIEDIIDFSECRQFIDTPVKRYSSGMYVKLAFAVAAHLDAEIMIMDEVLAVGDVKFQQKCLGKMGDAAGHEGKTVLYVSHNMGTIRRLCNRCVVLEQGKIIYDGEVNEAIKIYMGGVNEKLLQFYDLENTERSENFLGKKIRIESLSFEKELPIYEEHEKMRFYIKVHSNINVDGLRVYCPIKASDDSPVALIESTDICSINKGEKREIEVIVNLESMVAGSYYFKISVCSMGAYGNHESYDQPLSKIKFEIIEKEDSCERLKFLKQYWGFFRLEDVKAKEII